MLQADMTWTIAPSEKLGEDNPVTEAVGRFYDAFAAMLDTDLPLAEILPFHVNGMPYYQRLHASALSRSLRGSLTLGNQLHRTSGDWRQLLPRRNSALLARGDNQDDA